MQNKLVDLNNHLFSQLERLGDEDLKGEALEEEIERARAVTTVSQQIISNAALVLKSLQVQDDYLRSSTKLPDLFLLPESTESKVTKEGGK